jgi:hypothetical protein
MIATSHVLVKFPGYDLVFLDSLSELKFDYDINTLHVRLDFGPREYSWADVETRDLTSSKNTIMEKILAKKMTSLFTIDAVLISDRFNNPLHLLFRIINMHNKGFRDIKKDSLIEFFKLYCMYKEDKKMRIVSDAEMAKRQIIDSTCGLMFQLMRDYPGI